MSLRSRSRWIAAATAVAIPALVLSTACSTDKAAGPRSVATADTVALDESNAFTLGWWGVAGEPDSGYRTLNGDNLIAEDLDGSGNFSNYRLLAQYSLPKLAGKGAVDSARMYAYVCVNEGNVLSDSVVVDHVNWGAVYEDSASWGGETLQANIGTLVRDSTIGWKSLDVTSSIQADYAAKRGTTQYRLEFGLTTMPVGDRSVLLAGAECDEGQDDDANAGQGYVVIWAH